MSSKELKVVLSANVSQFKSAMQSISSEMKSVTSNTKQFATDVGKGLQDVGKKMTLAGVGIVASIGGIVAKGSEWSAQVEGQKFLYNNLDKSIQKAIDSSSKNAQAIGLTSQQYKNGATDISTYYKNMGLTSQATAELSGKTMDLVADLGAVKDVPFDEALADFKSALMGNYEAVDKYGISLSASTLENSEFVKSLGKSWNQLSDNEKMMAAYNEITRQGASAQGLAKQEAESFGMKFKLLKQQISETVGEIGTNLLPVLEPLVQKFSEVATKISEWVKENPKLTQTILVVTGIIGSLLAVLGPIIIMVGTLTIAVATFNVAMLPVAGTVALVVGAIVGLIAIGVALCSNWEEIKAFANKCWENVKKTISDVCTALGEFIKATWEGTKAFLSTCWNLISSLASSIWNTIKTTISNVWNSVSSVTSSIWNSIKSIVSSVWDSISSLASSVFNTVKTIISTAWNSVSSVTSSVLNGVKSTISNVFNSIKTSVSNIMTSITSVVRNAWDTVKNIFSSVLKPNIKMPKISISGKFSLNPPSVPKFGISWYSKGAIFKRPTVLGGIGVGDSHNGIGSRAEAILPIKELPKLLGLDKMQNNGGVTLSIENFNNNTDKDIEYLANELAFYLSRKKIGMGGAF